LDFLLSFPSSLHIRALILKQIQPAVLPIASNRRHVPGSIAQVFRLSKLITRKIHHSGLEHITLHFHHAQHRMLEHTSLFGLVLDDRVSVPASVAQYAA
jgi:hypothetical protein